MNSINEIQRVHRKVFRWRNHQEQINTRILNLFMELSDNGKKGIFRDMLEDEFDTRYLDIRDSFMKNYNQMKNIGERNHCKVFDEDDEKTVRLWYPVRDYIIGLYSY